MKKVLFFALFFSGALALRGQDYLNVMTFNLRYNNPGDSSNAWPFRIDKAASQILFNEVHLLGVQEALHDQMEDLQQRLPQFRYVGVGRDDGKEKGEYSAIFFDTSRLRLLESQTFWLSTTPSVPGSKGWDAAIIRIVTWARFTDKYNGKTFYMFNTHFDHMGKIARRESAKLLLQRVTEIAGISPVIVTGDFNATPEDEPIRILLDPASPQRLINTLNISAMDHYGPTGTFNGFQSHELSDQPIDHIMIKNNVGVLKHATLSESWMGHFSSDHFPVLARIKIL